MPSPAGPAKTPRKFRIGLTAPESPLSREIRATFHRNRFPVSRFVPLGGPADEGRLSEIDGEATVLETPSRETIADLDFLILSGSASDAAAASLARENNVPDHDATAVPAAAEGCSALLGGLSPAPLGAALALLLPAAEESDRGVQELFSQAGDALNMRATASAVFGDRLAFNLLRDSRTESLENRIRPELARLLGEGCALSLVCARAGTFHGYAGAVSLRFGSPAEARSARESLARNRALSLGEKAGHATPARAAESEEILVDPPQISADTLSLWFAFDGLALAARRAFAAARSRLA